MSVETFEFPLKKWKAGDFVIGRLIRSNKDKDFLELLVEKINFQNYKRIAKKRVGQIIHIDTPVYPTKPLLEAEWGTYIQVLKTGENTYEINQMEEAWE